MSAGLQVWNTNSFVQIDENYANHALYHRQDYTVSTIGPDSHYFGAYIDIAVHGQAIVAVSSPYPIALEAVFQSGSNKIYRYRALTVNAPLSLYAYLPSNLLSPSGNVGMEVFRADGTLAFSTGYDYLRVAHYDFSPDFGNSQGTVGLPGGVTYAVMASSPVGEYIQDSFDDTGGGWTNEMTTFLHFISINGNTYTKSRQQSRGHTTFTSQSAPIGTIGTYTSSLLLLDVTGQ